jgi:hypothetical protein
MDIGENDIINILNRCVINSFQIHLNNPPLVLRGPPPLQAFKTKDHKILKKKQDFLGKNKIFMGNPRFSREKTRFL